MKLKTLALAITASFALSGCFIDDIIDDIKDGAGDDLENATEQFTNLTDILSNTTTLNRQVLISPANKTIYTFSSESTGTSYSTAAAEFTYSLSDITLDLLDLESNPITIDPVDLYTTLPFVVTDLDGKIYSLGIDEDDCKSTVKFTGNTAEHAIMCNGMTTASAITISENSSLDNILDFTMPDGAINNMALYEEGSLAFINNDADGAFDEVSFDKFTIAECHLPEEWHEMEDPSASHCMNFHVDGMTVDDTMAGMGM